MVAILGLVCVSDVDVGAAVVVVGSTVVVVGATVIYTYKQLANYNAMFNKFI